ncbi:MAG: hypothetical protein QOH13_228 [Thermoleophilaceae bacterium]|nr:hypothetical protein [Thermoleophilaceae bacterium]
MSLRAATGRVGHIAVLNSAAFTASAPASPGTGSISSADGSSVYMVAPDRGSTVVTRIRGSDRTAQATLRLRGLFEVPSVAGVRGGLSSDGRTLVLGDHPGAHVSRFALIDTRSLGVRRMLALHGTYSFDAMSPDASTLYVLRFLSRDGTHYAVQALDMTDSHPVAHTVVEKGEPGEGMSGQALTRTSGADGNWVYTLYDGAGKAPFVHALSTVDKFTVCIDLDGLKGRRDLASLALDLRPGTKTLAVTAAGTPVALVKTDSFEVTAPPTPAPRRPSPTAGAAGSGRSTLQWLALGALATALAAAAATAHVLNRRTSQDLSH